MTYSFSNALSSRCNRSIASVKDCRYTALKFGFEAMSTKSLITPVASKSGRASSQSCKIRRSSGVVLHVILPGTVRFLFSPPLLGMRNCANNVLAVATSKFFLAASSDVASDT